MDSPLLFPAKLEKDKILILDETRVPFEEEYIEVRYLEDALRVLGEMKTRSLGQVLLFFYSCVLFTPFRDKRLSEDNLSLTGFKEFSIDKIVDEFKRVRPTFDFLFLGQILKQGISRGAETKKVVEGFVFGFDKARKQRAARLAELLPNPANILTICNVNGELIYLYRELEKRGKKANFIVSETRPYLQGTRLTFWELSKNNIPIKLICDNQAASLMESGEINCLVTGADRATKRGDVINKIGTYSLARLARHFNIPFYPLTQYPRDMDIEKIKIEQRPSFESFMYLEGDYDDIDAIYPSFDITKFEFVSECMELKV